MNTDRGIWPPYKVFYIEAMLFNARSAKASIERVSATLEALTEDSSGNLLDRMDQREFLNEVQNIVQQGAALSRYFWPIRQDEHRKARAEDLRTTYHVTSESTLKDRHLRNHLEHFDEKLDDYLKDGIVGIILPEYVGLAIERDGVPGHIFRGYYFDEGVFEVLGQRYKMLPLASEVLRLHDLLSVTLF